MTTRQSVSSGAIEMSWDPEARLAMLRFQAKTRATGRDAEVLVQALESWITDGREPFALLGDGQNLAGVDAEYRARWADFFQQHRDRTLIAFYNMNTFIRIAAEMFAIGSRVRVRGFAQEDEARAWLRQEGIGA